MTVLNKVLGMAAIAVVAAVLVPMAQAADESDWPTIMTTSEPLQVGSLHLAPGTYLFQLSPGTVSRTAVMIYSVDKQEWDGIVQGLPAFRSKSPREPMFTVKERASGRSGVLKYWFYPGWNHGIQFFDRAGD